MNDCNWRIICIARIGAEKEDKSQGAGVTSSTGKDYSFKCFFGLGGKDKE